MDSQVVMDEENSLEEKEAQKGKRTPWTLREFGGKTVWDWLPIVGALLIPVVIALGTGAITWQQGKIEDRRAQAERELAEQRAQDEALQAYLDQMSGLLLERELRASEKGSEVRTLARARTLTVLGRLDPSGKTALMQFLEEAALVQRADRRDPIISLRGAALSGAALRKADLIAANLSEADLNSADLIAASLTDANLRWASLSAANLSAANLRGADLRVARLDGAHLNGADLNGANLKDANLDGAYLSGADLNGAKLRDTNLKDADLNGAKLRGANLSAAGLWEANLFHADLTGADLTDAEGITNEELEQQAVSLEGATMPDGQKYEDWLKDR